MKATIFLLMILLASFSVNEMTVRGLVTDENGAPIGAVRVFEKGKSDFVTTDNYGLYTIKTSSEATLVFQASGFEMREIKVKNRARVDVVLYFIEFPEEEDAISAEVARDKKSRISSQPSMMYNGSGAIRSHEQYPDWNTEEYSTIHENGFKDPVNNPYSTFSIDVDAASYSNVRRFINNGSLPPKDAVRIEEMINYFDYDYPTPEQGPFNVISDLTVSPWNEKHYLLHVGIKGKEIPKDDLPASNLVFLLDVSGSMNSPNKLPLLKTSFRLLVDQLRPSDRVAIVVYAGAAGEVLPSTSGADKEAILESLDKLQAGGSTAGGQGIKLAYRIAKQNFIEGGNNRIILATDGDFNIGESSNAAMERLIEEKRNEGVFLTVLGFGMGNYKDSKMEILADKGNGNYAYIDNIMEAKKVLITEFGGTLFTIAKDVKIQIEFNPAKVAGYRLIGYENRLLNDEDFNDDKKDAGELGAGHTVTALYEIIPAGVESSFLKSIDELEFQKREDNKVTESSNDLVVLKLRYKNPDEDTSQLIKSRVKHQVTPWERAGENIQWSATVAAFGMVLRDSEFKGTSNYTDIIRWANSAKGSDSNGYRTEFIKLVESCSLMARN